VAAQGEEVVATADALDAQQLAPKAGEEGLDVALRGLIGPRAEGIGLGGL
jgi:hypothetical protein